MSKKGKRNKPAAPPPSPKKAGRMLLFAAAMVATLLALAIGAQIYMKKRPLELSGSEALAVGAAPHAPTKGSPSAKVVLVEFLDPACGACKTFFPHVKKIVESHSPRVRVVVRHVAFHRGADQVVRALEAARNQNKYWEALEALFGTQDQWVVQHRVQPGLIWGPLKAAGLDIDKLKADMGSAEITERIEKDVAAARQLVVTQTPTFFVNGKPLPEFGLNQLQDLVAREVRAAYGS